MDDDVETFAFRFAAAYRLPAAAFGITPARTRLALIRETLDIRFGPWRLTTGLDNVASAAVTGPYRFIRTAGPAHLSLADRGITFAVNGDAGVCLRFREPVPVTYPGPVPDWRHTAVTVTVADPARLAARLTRDRDVGAG